MFPILLPNNKFLNELNDKSLNKLVQDNKLANNGLKLTFTIEHCLQKCIFLKF